MTTESSEPDGAAEDHTAEDPKVAAAVAEALARDRLAEREKLRTQVDRENRIAARSAQVLSGNNPDREEAGTDGDR